MKSAYVAVTGIGAISAIGNDVASNRASLLRPAAGIRPLQFLDSIHQGCLPVGEIALSNTDLYHQLGLSTEQAFSRAALIGLKAALEAVKMAGFDPSAAGRTGFISATTVGGMDATEKYYGEYLTSGAHLPFIATHRCGYSTGQIAQKLGIKGYISTVSTACSSAANALMLGSRLIRSGQLDCVVAGGTDCLSKFTINGFHSLMIHSDEACRPFDEARKGLNLGEAAAYLVLESEERIKKTGKTPLAYLRGYGNANDAYHQTASSKNGEGAYLAMQRALKSAGLVPAQIDYVNAHGTATGNNDLSEGQALLRIFGAASQLPAFSSTKAYTGHTLAAAGALEAVFSMLAIQEQVIFPNLNFSTPIPEIRISPATQLSPQPIEHVLSNSFGFGGNCTSLIFSAHA